MRTAFHEQLSGLCAQLGEMCGLAVSAMAVKHRRQLSIHRDRSGRIAWRRLVARANVVAWALSGI